MSMHMQQPMIFRHQKLDDFYLLLIPTSEIRERLLRKLDAAEVSLNFSWFPVLILSLPEHLLLFIPQKYELRPLIMCDVAAAATHLIPFSVVAVMQDLQETFVLGVLEQRVVNIFLQQRSIKVAVVLAISAVLVIGVGATILETKAV
jgi:hypothetical protein